MRFGFLNNFSDQIAAPVSDTATDIELAGKASDIQTALQSADAVALTLFATDDQGNETQREVVYATVAAPPLVTVTRAQEGTTALAFNPGDGAENRLTKAPLDELRDNKVDKVTGKQLSDENYTSAEKTAVGSLGTAASSNVVDFAPAVHTHLATEVTYDNAASGATAADVQAALDDVYSQIGSLVGKTALETNVIDLTSATATATITLPASTILLPDAFDVVVVAASGAGGAPEIQIGPDDVTPASYLAATPITKTAVSGRDTFTPLVTDGVTALRVSVATAGTGTAYSVKVVARGYVMEI